jgi:hypothetical protein
MAFTQFKNLGNVLQTYDIAAQKQSFLVVTPQKAPALLADEITFTLNYVDYASSEAAICESLLYPVLRSVWKNFADTLALHSHRTWQIDDVLTGIPDYLIASVSKYGASVVGKPVLVTVEAKKDNFEEGWGQCAAAMIAAQQTNDKPDTVIYGIVSNGTVWEFAHLTNRVFTRETFAFDIYDLDTLYAALVHIFTHCKQQLLVA